MDVKEAVRTAKDYLGYLFEDEQITDVGLEEVVFEDMSNIWKITIGFSRPWEHNGPLVAKLTEGRPARSYKVLSINDDSGKVESLTDRVLRAAKYTD